MLQFKSSNTALACGLAGGAAATVVLGYVYCRIAHPRAKKKCPVSGANPVKADGASMSDAGKCPYLRKKHNDAGVAGPAGASEEKTQEPVKVRSTTASGSTVYESAKAVNEYIFFHFGDQKELMPYTFGPMDALNFPQRCATLCGEQCVAAGLSLDRALDVGCAVGASSFALARDFNEVVGIDFSQAFVDTADKMKADGKLDYSMLVEGDYSVTKSASLDAAIDRSRCTFRQGDACNLPADLGKFTVIFGGNLLCRLPNPRDLLKRLKSLLVEGGLVVFVSPYSWLDEYTPKDKWLGGRDASDSSDNLQAILAKDFNLLLTKDMPFLIREHARKFQYGVSQATVFQLKG